MELKFFTIESYESVSLFIRRVKFSISAIDDYTIQNISESMGKGIRVITLINNLANQNVKLEIGDYQLEDIKKHFSKMKVNTKPKGLNRRDDGLGNIEDLY